jgi:dCMP deaminase
MTRSEKWDRRFLDLAHHIAGWSKDPSTKVGAVIVRPDYTIASQGYNGFPRGVDDSLPIYEDRPLKLLRTVHAELNAILSAREPLHGCTVYVTPLCPCANCAAAIIQAGITRVVYRMGQLRPEWAASFGVTEQMFNEANITANRYPLE